MKIEDLRREYTAAGLREADASDDPLEQFGRWFDQALAAEVPEVNAMTLATADGAGRPAARIVLLKGFNDEGFVFYTNHESRKGQELAANPQAALLFFWVPLERQVRIEGPVTRVSREESEAYFRSRPRGSQIGAWASQQSAVIADRGELEARVRTLESQYADQDVPLPPRWGGYRLTPEAIEFWQGRPSRLHDRLRYQFEDGAWRRHRLSP